MINKKDLTLEQRISLMEFKQGLLFENSSLSRLLFEYDISAEQNHKLGDLMDEYRKQIELKQNVSHSVFEDSIYKIVPHVNGDYHFCEFYAKSCMEQGSWEEVFPALYGDMQKYKRI
jgi:hypothetical protein